jgi:hypothetical protein
LIDGLDQQAIEELGKRVVGRSTPSAEDFHVGFQNALGSPNGHRVNPREHCSRQLQINYR